MSSVIIHRVAQLEIHDYPACIHSYSLSIGDIETSCDCREVPRAEGRTCTVPMRYWDLQGWWRLVVPAWLPPVSSILMQGLAGSAACCCCCGHLWWVELKIQVAIEAGSNFSFSRMRMLATVLKFPAEYSSLYVCARVSALCYLQYLLRSVKAKYLCQLCLFLFDNCWCHFTFACESQPACCWVREGNRQ